MSLLCKPYSAWQVTRIRHRPEIGDYILADEYSAPMRVRNFTDRTAYLASASNLPNGSIFSTTHVKIKVPNLFDCGALAQFIQSHARRQLHRAYRTAPRKPPKVLTSRRFGWLSAAAIAQLGERQTEDLKVPGSIPGLGKGVCETVCVRGAWGEEGESGGGKLK